MCVQDGGDLHRGSVGDNFGGGGHCCVVGYCDIKGRPRRLTSSAILLVIFTRPGLRSPVVGVGGLGPPRSDDLPLHLLFCSKRAKIKYHRAHAGCTVRRAEAGRVSRQFHQFQMYFNAIRSRDYLGPGIRSLPTLPMAGDGDTTARTIGDVY